MKQLKPSQFEAVAKALAGRARMHTTQTLPDIEDFVQGVTIENKTAHGIAFVTLYEQTYQGKSDVRGIAGFVHDGACYHFDQRGIGDSWYPDSKAKLVAAQMLEELANATKRLAGLAERKANGTVVNFGPVSRTLLPNEIEAHKATLARGGSFALNPSGMGVGYRFYVARRGQVARYGSQCQPASAQARALLAAPGLVYDHTDHD